MWGRPAEPGDWVRAKDKVSTGFMDDITGGGLPAGSRGVVTGRSGRWLTVDFDTGFGTTTVQVRDDRCRIDRRRGGQEHFHNRARRMAIARVALAGFLLWPFAQFFILYLWHNRTLDGAIPTLTLAGLDSLGEMLVHLINSPVQTLIYLGFLWVLWRLAFH